MSKPRSQRAEDRHTDRHTDTPSLKSGSLPFGEFCQRRRAFPATLHESYPLPASRSLPARRRRPGRRRRDDAAGPAASDQGRRGGAVRSISAAGRPDRSIRLQGTEGRHRVEVGDRLPGHLCSLTPAAFAGSLIPGTLITPGTEIGGRSAEGIGGAGCPSETQLAPTLLTGRVRLDAVRQRPRLHKLLKFSQNFCMALVQVTRHAGVL